jgi:hypothetical protein
MLAFIPTGWAASKQKISALILCGAASYFDFREAGMARDSPLTIGASKPGTDNSGLFVNKTHKFCCDFFKTGLLFKTLC